MTMTEYIDLGHGRGWASADAAASIARIDAALGHALQITEAGRSAEQADANYAAYQAYLAGTGPWAPLAYNAANSVHCWGAAIDTDEGQQHVDLLADHGWIRTVYRNGVLIEPWHFEYSTDRDNHYNESEDDMTFTETDRANLEFIKNQLGGSGTRETSAREDIDQVLRNQDTQMSALGWIKQRIGGSLKNGAKSLTDMIRGIK